MAQSARAVIGAFVALALAAGASRLVAAPEAERTISFYHIHTKETLPVVYKRDGKYVSEAGDKIDWLMRDWRLNKSIKMDPVTIDILWEIHTELGSKEPIHVVCGYRSSGTNEMLRKTVGGQAKNSQHISGKAIDVYFPDVPPKFVRYAGLVRERGGVGYYPTSALPFVHIDTGRVRHWPRIPHDELALLFPNGHSKHIPDGGALSAGDYERAKSRQKELAIEVANYVELRVKPKTQYAIVASFGKPAPTPPAPKPAQRPVIAATPPAPAPVLAALVPPSPAAVPAAIKPAIMPPRPEPKLVAAPRQVERPSRFTPQPSDADRKNLNQLIQLAFLETVPKLVAPPAPVARPAKPAASTAAAPPEASNPPNVEPQATSRPDSDGWGAETRWVSAPEYDEDHPEELSYTPFPIFPMMTDTSSPDDPALAKLVHPDVAKPLEILDEDGEIQPMRLRPRQQVAELMWAQQFRGKAVSQADENIGESASPVPGGLTNRPVKTVAR